MTLSIKERKDEMVNYLASLNDIRNDIYLTTIVPRYYIEKPDRLLRIGEEVILGVYQYIYPRNKRNWHRLKRILPYMSTF